MDLQYVEFQQVDLSDSFFDSLKADYAEFEAWFQKKAKNKAYITKRPDGKLDGFLYIKPENEAVADVEPPLPVLNRLKVGTFKIDAHGTKLGERFVKKIFDHAVHDNVREIYVTVFEKHDGLIKLLTNYGFKPWGTKTTANGVELVLLKRLSWQDSSVDDNYPLVRASGVSKYLLSIYPMWHTRLFPDSILTTETADLIEDVSHTNSIHKVYLTGMKDSASLKAGDIILIYRTSDNQGPAHYRSVATSVCVVEGVKNISEFRTVEEFLKHCLPYSVFSEKELRAFYENRKYPILISFTYNLALPKRLTRKVLIDDIGMNASAYWGVLPITDVQFRSILQMSGINASFIVDQA